jgi:hypothetical protein
MRIAALVALTLLVAGCSHGHPGQSQPGAGAPGSTPATTTTASGKPAPSAAPAADAAIAQVIAWIEAGHPADPAGFHTATRDGVVTPLGDDIAFTAQAGKVACMTDAKHTGPAPVCLVELTNPPPAPATAYGEWKGGWVFFDGTNLQVGAARGDPGPFVDGDGPALADGDSLSFGDYRCRADRSGLFCVNYAHRSAVRFGTAGIEPFGCLQPVPPPDGVGLAFAC